MDFALLAFGSLFAILNPFSTAPTFLAITEGESPGQQISMASRACMLSFVLLVSFSLFGEGILGAFRVTVPALQIAGGLLMLRVSFQLLGGERRSLTVDERREAVEKEDITITPLAVPILCGPGTITTGIVLGAEATTPIEHLTLAIVVGIIYSTTFGFLFAAVRSTRFMGPLALKVLGRLMGMLLATVAVQFMISGMKAVMPFADTT